jgi:hypothetical protein
MLVAFKRDYPLGIDLGLLKMFNLYHLSRESFSEAPGTLTTGDIKGHALRSVSGEGHLTVKFPPPKKRVRGSAIDLY